jgi:very-short-patch-repair endonuclease
VVEIDGGSHLGDEDYDHGRTRVIEACGFHVARPAGG